MDIEAARRLGAIAAATIERLADDRPLQLGNRRRQIGAEPLTYGSLAGDDAWALRRQEISIDSPSGTR